MEEPKSEKPLRNPLGRRKKKKSALITALEIATLLAMRFNHLLSHDVKDIVPLAICLMTVLKCLLERNTSVSFLKRKKRKKSYINGIPKMGNGEK